MRKIKNKLFSTRVKAGKRIYYFDLKTSSEGINYLSIKELITGHKEGQVMIFEEHFPAFLEAFKKTLSSWKKSQSKAYSIERIRLVYPNAYVKWTQEEDEKLKSLAALGKTIKELAVIFKRKPNAISSHLKKLNTPGV